MICLSLYGLKTAHYDNESLISEALRKVRLLYKTEQLCSLLVMICNY